MPSSFALPHRCIGQGVISPAPFHGLSTQAVFLDAAARVGKQETQLVGGSRRAAGGLLTRRNERLCKRHTRPVCPPLEAKVGGHMIATSNSPGCSSAPGTGSLGIDREPW